MQKLILRANRLYMHYLAGTANWGGGGGLKTCTGDASLLGGGVQGLLPLENFEM